MIQNCVTLYSLKQLHYYIICYNNIIHYNIIQKQNPDKHVQIYTQTKNKYLPTLLVLVSL